MKFYHKKIAEGFNDYFKKEELEKQKLYGFYDAYFEELKKCFNLACKNKMSSNQCNKRRQNNKCGKKF